MSARLSWPSRAWPAAIVLGAISGAAIPARAQEAVILVRHAEKADESEDADLSDKGKARAEALARLLGRAAVDAIYVTQYKRTRQTVAPLAEALGLQPKQLHSDASEELAQRLRTEHAKDVVLVVGHSGSVPKLIKILGHAEPITIGHDEYDGLYVVVPRAGGAPSVLRLSY